MTLWKVFLKKTERVRLHSLLFIEKETKQRWNIKYPWKMLCLHPARRGRSLQIVEVAPQSHFLRVLCPVPLSHWWGPTPQPIHGSLALTWRRACVTFTQTLSHGSRATQDRQLIVRVLTSSEPTGGGSSHSLQYSGCETPWTVWKGKIYDTMTPGKLFELENPICYWGRAKGQFQALFF